MDKSLLTLDELTLFRCSEELKNPRKYYDLYDILCKLESKRITALDEIHGLNETTASFLTDKKEQLKELIIREWEANGYGYDPNQKAKCDFCNRKNNKYFFHIRNNKNGTVLTVGSTCVEKFLNIKGYDEQKLLVEQDKKQRMLLIHNAELYDYSQKVNQYLEAEKYFLSLPIVLPYDLFYELQQTISKMRYLCADYRRVFLPESQVEWNKYNKLKMQSDNFVQNNIDNPFICRKKELNWLMANKKQDVLENILHNNGMYTVDTIGSIYSLEFVKEHFDKINKCNRSRSITYGNCNQTSIMVFFNNQDYTNQISFHLSLQNLMYSVGCKSIMYDDFTYEAKDILPISCISNIKSNALTIIKHISNMVKDIGYIFLYNSLKNEIIIFRKKDKAIINIKAYDFLKVYSKIFLLSNYKIKQNLYRIINLAENKNWLSINKQKEQGIYQYISLLVEEQGALC